jgi:hypothetical protein
MKMQSIFKKNKRKKVYICVLQKIKNQNWNKNKVLKCYKFLKINDLNMTKKNKGPKCYK